MRLFSRLYRKLTTDKSDKQQMPAGGKKNDFSRRLQENIQKIKQQLGDSDDIILRDMVLGAEIKACILYVDGMADAAFVSEYVVQPLLADESQHIMNEPGFLLNIKNMVLTACEVTVAENFDTLFYNVLAGDTALLVDGASKALVISSRGFKNRGVTEPETETVVRGPREGFSEPLRINTSLLRRKINNPNLRLETISIGRQTKTKVSMVYLKNICNPKFVEELRKRLKRIDTDAVFGAGYIEQFIEDAPLSIFATVGNTERPDVAASKVLEGRIVILIDGTPISLSVPLLFVENFHSPEDYLIKPLFSSLIRGIRVLGFIITVYLPGIYIALTTFHQEMIPTQLLITMAASREGVPFPVFIEAVGMGLTFEFIREAGIRMPRPVGQAVSIVGALVIGQAAVSAGLVGAPIVIITALTAITIFMVPKLLDVATILRLVFTILAATSGLFGLVLGTMVLLIHMITLRSLGAPYLSPIAPINLTDLKDALIRVPPWANDTRPRVIGYYNRKKQADNLMPKPPQK